MVFGAGRSRASPTSRSSRAANKDLLGLMLPKPPQGDRRALRAPRGVGAIDGDASSRRHPSDTRSIFRLRSGELVIPLHRSTDRMIKAFGTHRALHKGRHGLLASDASPWVRCARPRLKGASTGPLRSGARRSPEHLGAAGNDRRRRRGRDCRASPPLVTPRSRAGTPRRTRVAL